MFPLCPLGSTFWRCRLHPAIFSRSKNPNFRFGIKHISFLKLVNAEKLMCSSYFGILFIIDDIAYSTFDLKDK